MLIERISEGYLIIRWWQGDVMRPICQPSYRFEPVDDLTCRADLMILSSEGGVEEMTKTRSRLR
jgi:hypothetical protein